MEDTCAASIDGETSRYYSTHTHTSDSPVPGHRAKATNVDRLGQACKLLRDTISCGVGFQEIINQDLNVQLVRALYAEIGAKVPNESIWQNDAASTGHMNETDTMISLQTCPTQSPLGHSLSRSPQSPESAPVANLQNLAVERHSADVNSSAQTGHANADTAQARSPMGFEKTIERAGLWQADKRHAKLNENKMANRAEYIARMMAAKSGKTITGASVTLRNTPSRPCRVKVPKVSPTMDELTPAASPKGLDIPVEVTEAQNSQDDAVFDPVSEKHGQTELARQRIEALRNRQGLQPKRSAANKQEPLSDYKTSSLHCEVTNNPLPVDPVHGVQDGHSSPNRPPSYFSPISVPTAFNIPGLFSKSDEESKSSTSAAHAVSSANRSNKEGQGATLYPMLTIDHQANAKEHMVSGRLEAQKAVDTSIDHTHQESIPIDVVRKPPARLKMSMSHLQDASVIIDISEGEESENNSNTSDDENSIGTDGQLLSNSYRHRSKLLDMPMSHQNTTIDRSASGGLTMLHKTLPMIDGASEPHDLETKEMEIRSMNRKIAELEQRIQTKRKVSQLQCQGNPVINPSDPVSSTDERSRDASSSSFPTIRPTIGNQTRDSATEEQLIEEKKHQQSRLANVTAEDDPMVDNEGSSPLSSMDQDKAGQRIRTNVEDHPARTLPLGTDHIEPYSVLNTFHKHNRSEIGDSILDKKMGELGAQFRLNKSEYNRIENDLRNAYERKRSHPYNNTMLTQSEDSLINPQIYADENFGKSIGSIGSSPLRICTVDRANSPIVPSEIQQTSIAVSTSFSPVQSGLIHQKPAVHNGNSMTMVWPQSTERPTSVDQDILQPVEDVSLKSASREGVIRASNDSQAAKIARSVPQTEPDSHYGVEGNCNDKDGYEPPSQIDVDQSPVNQACSDTVVQTSRNGNERLPAGDAYVAVYSTGADAVMPQTEYASQVRHADENGCTPYQVPELPQRLDGDESDDYEPPEPGLSTDNAALSPGQISLDADSRDPENLSADDFAHVKVVKHPETLANYVKDSHGRPPIKCTHFTPYASLLRSFKKTSSCPTASE